MAITYKTRKVFTFAIDAQRTPSKRWELDIRRSQIGYGKERFPVTQEHVSQGWDVTLDLKNDDDIEKVEDFFEDEYGPLSGFWFPEDQLAFEISTIASNTEVDITDQNLTKTWEDHPSIHLIFEKSGQGSQFAKITNVTDNGNRTERVTLDQSVSIDTTWRAHRLLFVRLASDTAEEQEMIAEGWVRYKLRFLELTQEYSSALTGERPVFLYHFWVNTPTKVDWYYTSFASDITSEGQTYTAKGIDHSGLVQRAGGEADEAELEAFYEADHPLDLFFPLPPPMPVWCEIIETTVPDPDTTTTLLTGIIREPKIRGKQMDARVVTNAEDSRIPSFVIGRPCNYQLYDTNCKLTQSDFNVSVTLESISVDGRTVQINGSLGSLGANYFAFGWLEVGDGKNLNRRHIIKSTVIDTNTHELLLSEALRGASVGDSATAVPGCDKKGSTCRDKFSNYVNFGGHEYIPGRNLTIQGMPVDRSAGGKK